MRLVDLTRLMDPGDIEKMPPEQRTGPTPLYPLVTPIRPAVEGAQVMARIFGCHPEDLPGGEGWGDEDLRMSTHVGTHVDAPLHYGSQCEGRPSRTISDIGIEELFCPAVVLDLREVSVPNEAYSVTALEAAVRANGATIEPGSAILLRTGQERYRVGEREMMRYPGMSREGTLYLGSLGAKVLGTDALGWDRPFGAMARAFRETGDAAQIWDGHFAGREREVFIVQQLSNLAAVPASGFHVGFFPLRLKGVSAAPARVVAFVP
ncbi:MAG: cyclase family protein [Dehalococcoidia bacterium]|nr:cyclase family protein [Chloroflexi bacterium CFX7]MCK6563945.1 cyclase family protein [Dehalococcoidia bacterium]NUQ54458.1 cyclase family protein [Dehalococcoidia bacterium]